MTNLQKGCILRNCKSVECELGRFPNVCILNPKSQCSSAGSAVLLVGAEVRNQAPISSNLRLKFNESN